MQCLKRFIILRCRMIFSPLGSMRESVVCYNVFPITCMKDSLNYHVFNYMYEGQPELSCVQWHVWRTAWTIMCSITCLKDSLNYHVFNYMYEGKSKLSCVQLHV